MITIYHKKDFEVFGQTVVAIGTFDGVHLGHRTILSELNQIGRTKNLTSCILTFDPHPRIVLGHKLGLLTSLPEKENLLKEQGVDLFVVYPFTEDFANLSPDEYFSEILLKKLHVKHLMVGYDHRFGKNRSGNIHFLMEKCRLNTIGLTVVDAIQDGEIAISSTRIRKFLEEGNIPQANRLLGYEYMIQGMVVHGMKRGKKLGFPTANIFALPDKLIPKSGVYACYLTIGTHSAKHPAVVNIGTNPTFDEKGPHKVEAHILDEEDFNLYGKSLTLHFLKRIRDEKKFTSPEELISQIRCDVACAKEFLKLS